MTARWPEVTRDRPCPACAKYRRCRLSEDGRCCLCFRVETPPQGWRLDTRRAGREGWLYWLPVAPTVTHAPPPARSLRIYRDPTMPPPAPRPSIDWAALQAQYTRAALFDGRGRRHALAAELGVPWWITHRSDVGWDGRAWTHPERDADGAIIGMTRRWPVRLGYRKCCVNGSRRGLTHPPHWWADRPALYVVEGASDTLAMSAAGLMCVGRPSASGGASHLTAWIRRLIPAERLVVVVGENDEREGGLWPGRDGARRVAAHLAAALPHSVTVSMPPDGAKDVREWLVTHTLAIAADRAHDAPSHVQQGEWHEAGGELAARLEGYGLESALRLIRRVRAAGGRTRLDARGLPEVTPGWVLSDADRLDLTLYRHPLAALLRDGYGD